MTTPTRIKGNALYLEIVPMINNTPVVTGAVQVKCDTTSVVLDSEEDNITTFCDAEAGGARRYFFQIGAVQSTDEDSLWRYLWDHSGQETAFTYAPHGNETPTADEPHFTGIVRIGPKPTLGGDASITDSFQFESRWEVVGEPTLDDGS